MDPLTAHRQVIQVHFAEFSQDASGRRRRSHRRLCRNCGLGVSRRSVYCSNCGKKVALWNGKDLHFILKISGIAVGGMVLLIAALYLLSSMGE